MQGQVRKFKSSVVPENEITPKSELFRLRRLVWLNRKERGEVIMRGELKLLSHGGGGGGLLPKRQKRDTALFIGFFDVGGFKALKKSPAVGGEVV